MILLFYVTLFSGFIKNLEISWDEKGDLDNLENLDNLGFFFFFLQPIFVFMQFE